MSSSRRGKNGRRPKHEGEVVRDWLRDKRLPDDNPIVFFCVGMYRNPKPVTVAKIMQLTQRVQATGNVDVLIHHICGSLTVAMRTQMAEAMLHHKNLTSAFLCDDDMDFPVTPEFDPLSRMLERDKDMVAALCTSREKGSVPFIGNLAEDGTVQMIQDEDIIGGNEPFQVDYTGFGMVLIKRKVFKGVLELLDGNIKAMFRPRNAWKDNAGAMDKLREATREYMDDPIGLGAEWLAHRINLIQASCDAMGEDYSFCRLVREAGFEIWVDPSFEVQHIGDYGYGRKDWLARRHFEREERAAAEEVEEAVQ